MMDYHFKTYHHKNPIKRFAHQSRIDFAIKLLSGISKSSKVIDFGCGKGYFIYELEKKVGCNIVGYDKYMPSEDVLITNNFEEVRLTNGYDYFTCFETLEHCHPPEQERIIRLAHTQLKPGGELIISVPIEIGPISLLKNALRLKTKDATFPDFTLKNIIKAAFLKPTTFHRNTLPYPGHFGFDHRLLENLISDIDGFQLTSKKYSPFHSLPTIMLNSQIFYVLRKI